MRKSRLLVFAAIFLLAATAVWAQRTHFNNIISTDGSENDTLGGDSVVVDSTLKIGGNLVVGGTQAVTGAQTFTGVATFSAGLRTDSVIKFGSGAYYTDAQAAVWMKFVNRSGSTIARYSPVIVDSTAQSIVAMVKVDAGPDTLTEALEIATEGGYWRIVAAGFSLANACSLFINGTAAQNIGGTAAAVRETLALTTNETYYTTSRHAWTDLDTLVSYGTETNDSINIKAYPYFAVKAAADNSTMLVGVTVDSIIDNDSAYVCVYGPARVTTTGAVPPGVNLQAAGSNNADAVASLTVGASLGHALEATSTNSDTIWAFIDHK